MNVGWKLKFQNVMSISDAYNVISVNLNCGYMLPNFPKKKHSSLGVQNRGETCLGGSDTALGEVLGAGVRAIQRWERAWKQA